MSGVLLVSNVHSYQGCVFSAAERLHEQQRRRQHAAQQLRLAAAVVRACDPACTNTGPEARLPVLLRLQEDARVSLAGSP